MLALVSLALVLGAPITSTAEPRASPSTRPGSDVRSAITPRATATSRPYWVFFGERDAHRAVDPRRTELSDRALARRAAHRTAVGLADERDLPVDAALVAEVVAAGAQVRTTSRWLDAVSVSATDGVAERIRRLPFVREVRSVRGANLPSANELPAALAAADSDYGEMFDQVSQMDLVALHERGFRGEGVVIGILDTGFNRIHEAFNHPEHPLNVLAEWDFINDDGNAGIDEGDPPNQHRHGTWILGTIAAYLPGVALGAAYDASFVLAKTEDVTSETPIEEDYYVAGLEFIEAHGADLATSSLGYFDWYASDDFDGATAVTSVAVNVATSNGLVCLTSVGNGGHDEDPTTFHLGAPADAFDVIACGAVSNEGSITGFSSDGPTADGRLKPELLARGADTVSVHSTDPSGLVTVSGTSLSTPLVAGATACVLQARRDLGVASLRAALFSTATDSQDGIAPDPLFVRGYGIVQANAASLWEFVPEDLDGDGVVDAGDLAILLGAWGECGERCVGDLDGDGVVDSSDLALLLGAWGA